MRKNLTAWLCGVVFLAGSAAVSAQTFSVLRFFAFSIRETACEQQRAVFEPGCVCRIVWGPRGRFLLAPANQYHRSRARSFRGPRLDKLSHALISNPSGMTLFKAFPSSGLSC